MNVAEIAHLGDISRASSLHESYGYMKRTGGRRQGGFWGPLLGALGIAGVPFLSSVGKSAGDWVGKHVFGKGILHPGESTRRYIGRRQGGLSFRDISKLIRSHGPEVLDVISRSGSSRQAAKNLLSFALDKAQMAAEMGATRGLSYLHQRAPGWIRSARQHIRSRYGVGMIPDRRMRRFSTRVTGTYYPGGL